MRNPYKVVRKGQDGRKQTMFLGSEEECKTWVKMLGSGYWNSIFEIVLRN